MSKKLQPTEPLTLPTLAGLAIESTCPLSPTVAADVSTYHADANAVERKISELLNARDKLIADAEKNTFGNLLSTARDQESQRKALEQSLSELHERRRLLLPKLIPDYEADAKDALQKHDDLLNATVEDLKKTGACDGIPADGNIAVDGGTVRYLPPTDAVLVNTARRMPQVMAVAGRMNRAKTTLDELRQICEYVPTVKDCSIKWRSSNNGLVVRLLADAAPAQTSQRSLPSAMVNVVKLVGLDKAIISDATKATLEEIAFIVDAKPTSLPNLRRNDIRLLLSRLPRTAEVKGLLEKIRSDESFQVLYSQRTGVGRDGCWDPWQ